MWHQIDLEELIAEAKKKEEAENSKDWLEDAMKVDGSPEGEQQEHPQEEDTYNIYISPEVAEILQMFGINEEQLIKEVKESVCRDPSR